MNLPNAKPELGRHCLAHWMEGYDTAEISRVLNVPEPDVERELHRAMEARRAVRKNLCGE